MTRVMSPQSEIREMASYFFIWFIYKRTVTSGCCRRGQDGECTTETRAKHHTLKPHFMTTSLSGIPLERNQLPIGSMNVKPLQDDRLPIASTKG